jgi:hypothetical protein
MNKKSVRGRKMLLGRRPDSSLSLRMTSERNCLLLRGLHHARNTGYTAKIRVVGLDLAHSPAYDVEEFLRLPPRVRESISYSDFLNNRGGRYDLFVGSGE